MRRFGRLVTLLGIVTWMALVGSFVMNAMDPLPDGSKILGSIVAGIVLLRQYYRVLRGSMTLDNIQTKLSFDVLIGFLIAAGIAGLFYVNDRWLLLELGNWATNIMLEAASFGIIMIGIGLLGIWPLAILLPIRNLKRSPSFFKKRQDLPTVKNKKDKE